MIHCLASRSRVCTIAAAGKGLLTLEKPGFSSQATGFSGNMDPSQKSPESMPDQGCLKFCLLFYFYFFNTGHLGPWIWSFSTVIFLATCMPSGLRKRQLIPPPSSALTWLMHTSEFHGQTLLQTGSLRGGKQATGSRTGLVGWKHNRHKTQSRLLAPHPMLPAPGKPGPPGLISKRPASA